VRVTAYGVGAVMIRQADIRQLIGYFLLLVGALPELVILSPVREVPSGLYIILLVTSITITSLAIGWGVARVTNAS
jgi:NADH:ubiquinone oxidoreductase subunit K